MPLVVHVFHTSNREVIFPTVLEDGGDVAGGIKMKCVGGWGGHNYCGCHL